jgi:hypothetical protein
VTTLFFVSNLEGAIKNQNMSGAIKMNGTNYKLKEKPTQKQFHIVFSSVKVFVKSNFPNVRAVR